MSRVGPAIAGALLAALASLRTLVAISPSIWFDVDPGLGADRAGEALPMAGIGPSGSLAIDLAMMAVSAWLLLAFAGRAAMLVAAAALAVLPADLMVDESAARLGWRGWDWVAAWVASAAAVAVARNPRAEARLAWSAMVSVLLGTCGAWLARGGWQWLVEHPDTVAFFRSGQGQAFLTDRGWEPDGPQAMTYIRRLEQREMTGWFGLANILSGVLAVAAVALVGVPRVEGRRGGSWMLLAGACAVAVLLNGGKGAIVAMGFGLLAVAILRMRRCSPTLCATAAISFVLLSSLAAVVRGLLPGIWPVGERSLLFRWHYLQTAWPAWLERPLRGTGAERFQDASARWRPADAVELVQSAHAAFVDWVCQLGAGGAAWILAAMALLIWSARGAAQEPPPLPAPPARDGRPQWIVTLACVLAAAVALRLEAHTLGSMDLVVRLVGTAAWAGTAVMLLPRLWSARSCGARLLFPAALVAICHAQVEMTLWNPGSAAWLLLVVGAAIPPHALATDARELAVPPRRWMRASAASLALVAMVMALPAWGVQRRIERGLESAAQSLVHRLRPGSGVEAAVARREAADALRPWSRLLACDQLLRAAVATGPASTRGKADLRAACVDADDAVDRGPGLLMATRLEALQQASLAWLALAEATGEHPDLVGARERALAVTELDRRSAALWLRAARLAERVNDPDAAVYARRAIAADDAMALDPLTRLAPRDRAEADRLAGLTGSAPAEER